MKISPYQIVVADDHEPFRQILKTLLMRSSDLIVIGEASDGLELLSLLGVLEPSLVILDISMPNLNGIEATRQIKKSSPYTKILILTLHPEEEYLHQALAAGADGYLLKENFYSSLFSAIAEILHGGVYVAPRLRKKLKSGEIEKLSKDIQEHENG
jgi:two-component system, NarL family, response regulator NreC